MYLNSELYNQSLQEAGIDQPPKYEVLLSRKEAARYIGFKTNTLAVWDCTKRYDLKPIKIGRSVRYKKSVLDNFLDEMMKP